MILSLTLEEFCHLPYRYIVTNPQGRRPPTGTGDERFFYYWKVSPLTMERVVWNNRVTSWGHLRVTVEVRYFRVTRYPTMTQGWYKDDPRESAVECRQKIPLCEAVDVL